MPGGVSTAAMTEASNMTDEDLIPVNISSSRFPRRPGLNALQHHDPGNRHAYRGVGHTSERSRMMER